ncbi:MAG: ribosome recycling factor [Rickettsiaceae bacterium]|nr:ribosome recycling factor [Rickettsiaceae bacterium]
MDAELEQFLTEKMDKAMSVLDRELSGLRTGRASVNLLDSVTVDAYGSEMPLSQVSTISVPEAKSLSVQVWDKGMVSFVEKAIIEANLGLNPIVDGQLVRINLPPLSEERRKELVKVAHRYGENTKIAIRNVRKEGMDKIKAMEKNKEISQDEQHKIADEIQKTTDEYNNLIDKRIMTKEEDILVI